MRPGTEGQEICEPGFKDTPRLVCSPPGGTLKAAHVKEWEEEYDPITERDKVPTRFGWDQRWGTGPDGTGFLEDWSGLEGRSRVPGREGISLVGCDTLAHIPQVGIQS